MIKSRVFARYYAELEELGIGSHSFNRAVECELIRLHAKALLTAPWAQAVLVLGVGVLVHDWVLPEILMTWGAVSIGIECVRALYASRVLRRNNPVSLAPIQARLSAMATLSGAWLGLGAGIFISMLPVLAQGLLSVIIFAIPGSQFPVTSFRMIIYYMTALLTPVMYHWAAAFPEQAHVVIGLVLLYLLYILNGTVGREGLLRQFVVMRFKNERMLKDLEQRNFEVTDALQLAEQSAKARTRVLAAASHDLRQPLHALSVYSAILMSNPEPETLKEVAGNIDRLVRVLSSLLHGLLDLSRLSAEFYVPDRQRISLDRLAAEICDEFESHAEAKQIALIRELQHVRLYDDKIGIARIIRNLLDNAIKYTDRGAVRVTTEQSGDTASLTISDTGKGIPPDEQERIFEEFYQLENPAYELGKGIGLGLTIVQRLCELLDVKLSLISNPGTGSSFRLLFRSVVHETTVRPAVTEWEADRLQGLRIFVIDDDSDIVESTAALLRSWGVDVRTATSIHEAESLFSRAGIPDLFIVDLQLGDCEHGAELAHRLQQQYGPFPVMVVTGETASGALQQGKTQRYRMLQKPIAGEVLFAAICAMLNPE